MREVLTGKTRLCARRLGAVLGAAATVVVICLSLGSSAALAAGEAHPFEFSFGSFSNPNGIAIDEASGDVYVADIGTGAVYKFDASGNPVEFVARHSDALTGGATPAGSFSFPSAPGTPATIAVDNSTSSADSSRGDLYVMDAGHGVVDKFSADGEYLSQITGPFEEGLIGLATTPDGNLRVAVAARAGYEVPLYEKVDVFDDAKVNILLKQDHKLADRAPDESASYRVPEDGLAVSPAGDYYNLFECGCVEKFGQPLLTGLGRVDAGRGDVAMAVDPATGHLYVDDQSSVVEWDTGGLNGYDYPSGSEDIGTGAEVATFGSPELAGLSTNEGGIAIDGATGEIYVSDPGHGTVDAFATDVPGVAADAPMNVTETGATLQGTVNPRGAPITSCAFEYEKAPKGGLGAEGEKLEFAVPVRVFHRSVPCSQSASELGTGTSAVDVSAPVSALEPGTLYYFRLAAGNATGAGFSEGMVATVNAGFGVKSFGVAFLNEDGTADAQAGSHPYEMVTQISFNTMTVPRIAGADSPYERRPVGAPKDILITLPSGLVGDPNATAKKCTLAQLDEGNWANTNLEFNTGCPHEAKVGDLTLETLGYGNGEYTLNNMVPPRGVAAQLGVRTYFPESFINVGPVAGGDYPLRAESLQIPDVAPIFSIRVATDGVVGSGASRKPFLTLPTSCAGPLLSAVSVDSYESPGNYVSLPLQATRNGTGEAVLLTGCSKLQFPPEISAAPDTSDASSSSGLTVHVKVPQTAAFNPNGLAESALRNTTVALPAGVAINPAGGDGLQGCSSDPGALPSGALGSPGDQIGYLGEAELNKAYEEGVHWDTFTPEMPNPLIAGSNFCPNGSKIANVKIKTPLLEHELEGAMYLAVQDANPFNSLVAMYIVTEDPFSGSLIKLAGEVQLCAGAGQVIEGISCGGSGQIVTTFKNTPDLPFEDLEIHFFGGERAPLSTPARCGSYTTKAIFVPWDGNSPVTSESSFAIDHGPGGGPCPGASLPFAPALAAGAPNVQAGGFTPFTMTMSRPDGSQNLDAIALHMPPGLSGTLTGVELCPEPQADQGTCGPRSQIGETIVSVGVGSDPFSVTGGKVYLTGPYEGAPYGLSIVNPAKAGPFDLENTPAKHPACDCLVVRAKIEIDPTTAALTVISDTTGPYRIPTMLEGIPLQIQHINVSITRNGFTFNPTNCARMAITGTLTSSEGAADALSVPFQVTNCARLAFKPSFKVSTSARTSRTSGASLDVKLDYPKAPFGTQANVAKARVELPKQLPSRLTTLQKACTDAVFSANPANCPAASRIGSATATTPILPVALSGPAYFVSHGGAKFPELIIVLSGYGTTVELHGETFISKAGVTSTTFNSVPDVPVGEFELKLPEGPDSALAANGDLCAEKLVMPTTFTAQNGAVVEEKTPIHVDGCKPAIRVLRHSVNGKWASVVVSVPAAGRLVAGGGGVIRTSRKIAKASVVTLRLRLSKSEQRFIARHHARRLRVPITLSFKPARGRNLKAIVAVLMR